MNLGLHIPLSNYKAVSLFDNRIINLRKKTVVYCPYSCNWASKVKGNSPFVRLDEWIVNFKSNDKM